MSSVRIAAQIRSAKQELDEVNSQMEMLRKRKRDLEVKISTLHATLENEENRPNSVKYEKNTFPWTDKLYHALKTIFNLKDFRSHQLKAINASMSKEDVLLIMPTGGGKSLCFQLPAVLSKGITLVVSPLISLMEDQLNEMNRLKIPTVVLNSTIEKEEKNDIYRQMLNHESRLKIIYVTPEMMAKNKGFMHQVERCYLENRLERVVIDEVHCCSQWGHDFRKDYKFLGIMKSLCPETPILGLTATATPCVITDVQKILNIEGCNVYKDNFYRANLKYIIKVVPDGKDTRMNMIFAMLKGQFEKQSGIIYCLTVKETEEVAANLDKNGIKAACYHAKLSPVERADTQRRWYCNKLSVIVATVAFGMGINKLDVRFVIHYSMSKTIESYYQETGRAGRDGKPSECVLFFKFQDVFRATNMAFTEKNGLEMVYKMLGFCLNKKECRKKLLANYFDDEWNGECGMMCDNCLEGNDCPLVDVSHYYKDIITILRHCIAIKERMTATKLIDAWFGKKCRGKVEGISAPDLSKESCEVILGHLLINGYLKEDISFTAYCTNSYLLPGSKGHSLYQNKSGPIMFPIRLESKSKAKNAMKTPKRAKALEGGEVVNENQTKKKKAFDPPFKNGESSSYNSNNDNNHQYKDENGVVIFESDIEIESDNGLIQLDSD